MFKLVINSVLRKDQPEKNKCNELREFGEILQHYRIRDKFHCIKTYVFA